ALLDDQVADEKDRFAALTKKLGGIGQQTNDVRANLLQAMTHASQLDKEQALEDIRPIVEQHAAITSLAGMGHLYGDALKIPLNEVAVRERVKALAAEYPVWEPAALTAVPMPADADSNESAEPGAEVAAA